MPKCHVGYFRFCCKKIVYFLLRNYFQCAPPPLMKNVLLYEFISIQIEGIFTVLPKMFFHQNLKMKSRNLLYFDSKYRLTKMCILARSKMYPPINMWMIDYSS